MIRTRGFFSDEKGATAVEFAFVGPVFLVLLFGLMQGGFWVLSSVSLQHSAELAARCAAVQSSQCNCTTSGCTVAEIQTYAANQVVAFDVPTTAFTVTGIGAADATCAGVKVTGSYTPLAFTASLGLPTYTAAASACYPTAATVPSRI